MTFEEWYTTKYEGHDSGLLMTYSAAKQAWQAALESRVLAERKYATCPNCNGTGSHGGRMHIDDKGASEYESYKCDVCDGFGFLTYPAPDDANQWVSVTDKLPDEETDVLVTGPAWNKEDYSEGRYLSLGKLEEGIWKGDDGGDLHTPSHWMPLPKAPAITRAMQDERASEEGGSNE